MSLKEKLRHWLDQRWNYEIQCDVFDGLNREEIEKLAKKYDIDTSLSRLEICQKLAKILQTKKEEYENVLKESGCTNTMDPISGTNVDDIDTRELLTISQDGQQYCFEIEGIYKNVFVNNNPKNPYTNVPFNEESLKFIESEYEKFKLLRGKKFDKYTYASDTNLTAIVNQLSNYIPYITGLDRFIKASRQQINNFLYVLSEYNIDIPNVWGIQPEIVDIPVERDTRLIENKIQIVRELIKWIIKNDYIYTREAWYDTFEQETPDFDINSELMLAVYNNAHIREINELLDRGADIESTDENGMSLLHIALKYESDIEIVEYLVQKGINIESRDYLGNTPIMYSIETNAYNDTKFLIEKGADLTITNNFGESPLYIASKNADKELIKLLLDNLEIIDDAHIQEIIINILNTDDIDLVESLFEKDIDPYIILNEDGNTPLTYALNKSLSREIINFLREYINR